MLYWKKGGVLDPIGYEKQFRYIWARENLRYVKIRHKYNVFLLKNPTSGWYFEHNTLPGFQSNVIIRNIPSGRDIRKWFHKCRHICKTLFHHHTLPQHDWLLSNHAFNNYKCTGWKNMNLKIHEDIPENSRPYRCFMIYPNKSSLRHYNVFLIRIKFIRVHWAQNFLKKKSKLRVRLRIILKVQIRYEKREKSPRVIPEISAIKHGFASK